MVRNQKRGKCKRMFRYSQFANRHSFFAIRFSRYVQGQVGSVLRKGRLYFYLKAMILLEVAHLCVP